MAQSGPIILLVDNDCRERARIASVLREAGFRVVAVAEPFGGYAALPGEPFAAAVIALPGANGGALLRHLRQFQPELPAVLALAPAAMALSHEDGTIVVKRPLDARQLLGCVFELVLSESDEDSASDLSPGHAAELGISAARLACLRRRQQVAAVSGAVHLVQDLACQIRDAAVGYPLLRALRAASVEAPAAA